MLKRKLKIGLLIDDLNQPAWVYEMLSSIKDSEYALIDLIVLNDAPLPKNRNSIGKLNSHRGKILHLVLKKLLHKVSDKLVNRPSKTRNAFKQHNLSKLLPDIPIILIKPIQKKYSSYIAKEGIEKIQAYDIDILIRLGFGILRGDILNSIRYGIWSYHHGDNRINRGGPAGYREAMEEWPITGSILQILNEDLNNGKILYRSWSCTIIRSPLENLDNYFWKTSLFIPRKLKELYNVGEEEFFKRVAKENSHPQIYSRQLYVEPTNGENFKYISNNIYRKFKNKISNQLYLEQWILLFKFEEDITGSLWRYKRIVPPLDRFWADPHVIKKKGIYYVFHEELIYSSNKGHISVLTIGEDGSYDEPRTIIQKPYHLSYPFIFETNDQLYMIPESAENRTVELYQCDKFPDKWVFKTNLMENVCACDTTVHFMNNKWWLFTNISEIDGVSTWDELFLFFSDDLVSGTWTPHPQNPIVSDARNARPAGPLFERGGKLYRPAQNCSKRYGYGFNLNLIEELSETTYKEAVVCGVTPEWDKDLLATHSLCHNNGLTVIDALIKRPRFTASVK